MAWMPPDPVLRRPSEVVVVALAAPYRGQVFKPRAQPAIAELFGLDDLGRALPWVQEPAAPSTGLGQIAGEWDVDSMVQVVEDREGD